MDDRYSWETADGSAPPTITEILLPRGRETKISYRREFAWFPVDCADDGWVWMRPVWHVYLQGIPAFYTRAILPLGWHK